jgi:hypothetical protein
MMKMVCAFVAVVLLLAFTAVNLFIPYALILLGLAAGMAFLFGIPCGLFARDRKGECRLGIC